MTRPAETAVCTAVRGTLKSLPVGSLAAVACSGGPDSVALAAASADVAGAAGVSCGAVVVDHGLQLDSGDVAAAAAQTCENLGLAPVLTLQVAVASDDGDGPEAAARKARYQGIEDACDRLGIGAVLLGHTLDDQAETVLMGLSRGSGTRSLAGMPKVRGRYHRPLLGLPRAVVRSAYPDLGGHQDAHNQDPRFLRARVRHELLPALVRGAGWACRPPSPAAPNSFERRRRRPGMGGPAHRTAHSCHRGRRGRRGRRTAGCPDCRAGQGPARCIDRGGAGRWSPHPRPRLRAGGPDRSLAWPRAGRLAGRRDGRAVIWQSGDRPAVADLGAK